MPIETKKDTFLDLTINVVTDRPSTEDMYSGLKARYTEPRTSNVLWDMSAADVSYVTAGVLKDFVANSVAMGHDLPGGRTAILAPKDLQFGIARMSGAFAEIENAPFDLRVFRSRHEAMRWLMTGDENADFPD